MKRLFSTLLALGVLCLAANSGLGQTCEAGRNDSSKPEVYIVKDEFKIYFDFNHLPAEAFPRKR
jgi:hypothetical protein